MSTKKPGKRSSKTTEFKTINLSFSLKDRTIINQWVEDRDFDVSDWIVKAVEQGWKISFSYSDYFDCYYMSLTAKNTDTPYNGIVYLMRHGDLVKLFYMCWYVLNELVPQQAAVLLGEAADTDW